MHKLIATSVGSVAAITAAVVYQVNKENEKTITENETSSNFSIKKNYAEAIKKATKSLKRTKEELGLPGIVIGVSVDGETVWAEGFGMSNVETRTRCNAKTKMRIASISKTITTSLLATLVESGQLDLDAAIQQYTEFPAKMVNGQLVTITARQLACHKAGIRHYNITEGKDDGPEMYLKDRFKTVAESVAIFSGSDLLFEPGQGFHYTTHGYTLLSAVLEGAAKTPFDKLMNNHITKLGLKNTHLDEISPLIYNRASYYRRNSDGRLVNAELTDNSYKWAGGGLLSDVGDIVMFGNIMLYSYQQNGMGQHDFLKRSTVELLWTPELKTTISWSQQAGYGLGWMVVPREPGWVGGQRKRYHVGHSGAAVGASSILLVYPLSPAPGQHEFQENPSGVTVAILANLEDVGLYQLADEIAEYFIQERGERVKKGLALGA